METSAVFEGLETPGMWTIVLISSIGFMNIPVGWRVCGLFKQDINQWLKGTMNGKGYGVLAPN